MFVVLKVLCSQNKTSFFNKTDENFFEEQEYSIFNIVWFKVLWHERRNWKYFAVVLLAFGVISEVMFCISVEVKYIWGSDLVSFPLKFDKLKGGISH